MSKIGKKPINIPDNVFVLIEECKIIVKGPKGELTTKFDPNINIEVKENQVIVRPKKKIKKFYALWGLYASLISNMICGVKNGYKKQLELKGIGYKVAKKGDDIELNVGFSHPILFKAPSGIKFEVDRNIITVIGIDKQLVGQTAADIRSKRKPEPYKGKGIRYLGEQVRIKSGKKAAGTSE